MTDYTSDVLLDVLTAHAKRDLAEVEKRLGRRFQARSTRRRDQNLRSVILREIQAYDRLRELWAR